MTNLIVKIDERVITTDDIVYTAEQTFTRGLTTWFYTKESGRIMGYKILRKITPKRDPEYFL